MWTRKAEGRCLLDFSVLCHAPSRHLPFSDSPYPPVPARSALGPPFPSFLRSARPVDVSDLALYLFLCKLKSELLGDTLGKDKPGSKTSGYSGA